MSRRVFYIVHLDKGRILALAVIGAGLILTAFATGFRLAGNRGAQPSPTSINSMDIARDATRSLLPSRAEEAGTKPSGVASDEARPAERPESVVRGEEKSPERTTDRTTDRASERDAEPSLKLSEPGNRKGQDDPRPALADRRVNLLDSALPEDPGKKDLDVYRKKHPAVAESDEKPARKDRKHTVKREKKEKSKEKAKERDRKKKTDHSKKPSQKKKKAEQDSARSDDQAAAEEQASPAPKPEVAREVYTLQMGAYQSREAATRFAEEVRRHGVPVYVRKSGDVHTVRTESITDRDELSRTEKKLRGLNFAPVTVRLKNQ